MHRQLQFILTAAASFVCAAEMSAQEFVYDGLNYEVISIEEGLASVARNPVASGDIVIPSVVEYDNNGEQLFLTVTALGESAFDGTFIKSVRIPDTVTEIGNYAFDNCNDLQSVEFGSSIITIGDYAFRYCTSLVSVELPETVEEIGKFGFGYCDNLEYAYLGENLKAINYALFANNYKLRHINIPATVTEIGVSAFSDCQALEELPLPEGLTAIKTSAIYRCMALRELVIPSSVVSIAMSNFWYCESLTKVMSLTEAPLPLDAGNFSHSPMTTLIVPEDLIEQYAEAEVWQNFESIVGIHKPDFMVDGIAYTAPADNMVSISYIADHGTEINIPSIVSTDSASWQVSAIGMNAAILNDNIEALTLGENTNPATTLTIEEAAFANCTGLNEITSNYLVPPVADDNVFAPEVYSNATLLVADTDAYNESPYCWRLFSNIQTGIESIDSESTDDNDDAVTYTLSGIRTSGKDLPAGIYIRRNSSGKTSKIIIR